MAVRAVRLPGPIPISNAWTSVYTVPSGRTLIIRQVWIIGESGTPGSVQIGLNGTGTANWWHHGLSLSAPGTTTILSGLVMNPGDVMWMKLAAAGVAHVWIFGALLLGAPQ